MKRIILSVMVMAFAVAVQAGDGGCCQDKEQAGCCANKVKTSLMARPATKLKAAAVPAR